MSSLLNNASLLLNPAGSIISYQEDKIYSVLPKDGTGDFTFSGGDGGTRVNQQGYIEQTPANFMLNSGTTWTPYNVTVTTGVTDPVGGTGAYTIGSIASGNITDYAYKLSNAMSLPAGTTFTYSIYMKGSGTIATYVERSVSGTYFLDVKTHTLSSEWQVFTHSYTVSSNADGVGVYVGNATGTTATSVDIAFPMLNYGSTAKPYQPTTDRLNYPRITYQNGRGALLSEPQRTNLNTYSQFISSSTYGSTGLTIVYGSTTSPDGTQNASKLVEDTSTNQRYILKSSPFGSFGTYVCSFYAKPNGREWIYFEVGAVYGYANIANGELGSTGTFAAGWTFNNYGIEPWKDGWYRVWITGTWSSGGAYYAPKIHPAISNGNFSYTGNGVSGIYVYGIQVEAGSFPTSYIPTTSATVTRPGDVTTKTGASSIINASEGTIYVDFIFGDNDTGGSDQNLTMLYSGGYSNSVFFACYGSSIKKLYGWITNGATQVNIQSPTLYKGQRVKAALTYKNNDYIMYVNGVSAGTQAQPVPSLDTIIIGNQIGGTSQAPNPLATTALFNTRLTNTQLAELTTVRSGSGGNISYYGPYTIHTFTGSATFTPSFSGQVEVLVVAGGGGGGSAGDAFYEAGGGGGAGGLLYASSYGVSQGTGITVTIGAGGVGGLSYTSTSPSNRSGNGSNSVFGGLTAIGGGGGGGAYYGANSGGSGGGADGWYSNAVGVPYGNGITGQGNRGGAGNGLISTSGAGGGGGGAGAIGSNGLGSGNLTGGAGGNGLPYSISGFSTYYAGGGGGKTAVVGSGAGGAGGLGGGGNGGVAGSVALGAAGVNYTGGGGGGGLSTSTATGAGGTGVVIVRYLT